MVSYAVQQYVQTVKLFCETVNMSINKIVEFWGQVNPPIIHERPLYLQPLAVHYRKVV